MKKILTLSLLITSMVPVACTQYTPSMMNAQPLQVSQSAMMEQITLSDVTQEKLAALGQHFGRYGQGMMELTMTYDPSSSSFTAMNAVHKLDWVKKILATHGVKNITAQTHAMPSGTPSLLVSYTMLQASAPQGCDVMPGIETDRTTTRFLGDYQFGCSTDTMVARQVAKPSDLLGTEQTGMGDGRRAAGAIEEYSKGVPREPLEGVERSDLTSE